jgi:tetratricopeptide (TPR) repeat protein
MNERSWFPPRNRTDQKGIPFTALNIRLLIPVVMAAFIAAASSGFAVSEDFDSIFKKASVHYSQGEYKKALKLFKKANGMKKNSFECLWGLTVTYSKLGDFKNALSTCDKLINLKSDNPVLMAKAWNLQGNTLFSAAMMNLGGPALEQLHEAEVAFRKTLNINPGSNVAHYNLGITLIRLNRTDEGLGELRAYLRNAEEPDIAEKARMIVGASKIPIPVIEVIQARKYELLKNYRVQITLSIRNWAEFPAALFGSLQDLPPCEMGSGGTARLEVTVLSDQYPNFLPMCHITKPEGLRNLSVFYEFPKKSSSSASEIKKVYVRIKDRLTGFTVFSDPVPLP